MAEATFQRPNGKTYRPRKPGLVAHAFDDGDGDCGVIVLGTLDIDEARPFAAEMIAYWFDPDYVPLRPHIGWMRLGLNYGQEQWQEDPARGRPGVSFRADSPARPAVSSTPERKPR